MRALTITAVTALAITASACATKHYPIAPALSDVEWRGMTCEQLKLEVAKTEAIRQQIADKANIDWRSAMGFLGDFGVGNAMARSEADRAVNNRLSLLKQAQGHKNCPA